MKFNEWLCGYVLAIIGSRDWLRTKNTAMCFTLLAQKSLEVGQKFKFSTENYSTKSVLDL